MIVKAKSVYRVGETPGVGPAPALPLEEHIRQIEVLGQRIDGYVRFMCQIAGLSGTSAEAKERAVTAFHERMIVVESQLARIHDELRLE